MDGSDSRPRDRVVLFVVFGSHCVCRRDIEGATGRDSGGGVMMLLILLLIVLSDIGVERHMMLMMKLF